MDINKSAEIKPIIINQPDKRDQKIALGVSNINSDILQSSFVKLIVGKPGCGKSHLLREFILNPELYYKRFSLVLFITPSFFEDSRITLDSKNHIPSIDVNWIFDRLYEFRNHIIEKFPDEFSTESNKNDNDNHTDQLKKTFVNNNDFFFKKKMIDMHEEIFLKKKNEDTTTTNTTSSLQSKKIEDTPSPMEEKKRKKARNILIIWDDVIAEIKKCEKDAKFMSLFYNRRHILGSAFLISHIITSQKYSLCPAKIRSVLTAVISFPLMSMDWKKLEEECIYDSFDKRWIAKFLKDCRNERFSFMYIRLDNSKIFYKFEKCINS